MSELVPTQSGSVSAAALEKVVAENDLSKLTSAQRLEFYSGICNSLGLNPLTRPFQYIVLNGKLTLYATKDCTEQLRKIYNVSITLTDKRFDQDVYVVTAQARMPDGRVDESTGAVTVGTLKGDARANALMKAETKAKRRVTLSICGMGILDENEISTIADAKFVQANYETGEVTQTSESPPLPDGSAWSIKVRSCIEELQLTRTEYHKLGELCDSAGLRTDEMVVKAAADGCKSYSDAYDYIESRLDDGPREAEPFGSKMPEGTQPKLEEPQNGAPEYEPKGFKFSPGELARARQLAKQLDVERDALMAQAWEQGCRTYEAFAELANELIQLKKSATEEVPA